MIVITKEIFRELLKLLIQTQSVKLNITGSSQWLPLPKKIKKQKKMMIAGKFGLELRL